VKSAKGISPTLTESGEEVTVHWDGIVDATVDDWIGVYSPPDADDRDFLNYINVTASPTFADGHGR
jgi:hypothetical protein